ncbi:MAG: HAMP domain-containing histidine kinase, partial [Dactylosporangium sp.]|nr:HAMP domain-containing histidine kinase [Dactylosporangium sp.]
IGTVRLGFGSAVTSGRPVAWGWVAGASLVALLGALAVSWFVTRWLTRPLAALAAAARAFAGGDRAARSGVRDQGELGEVGRALDHLTDEVVRSETVRRQLAADVAHELRTPLAALRAGLEELRDGYAEPDVVRLTTLHDQALRLGRVVEDLAELSAAEAAAMSLHLARIDLAEVVEQTLAARRAQLRAAEVEAGTDIRGPLEVLGDIDRLHQTIGNLLANAARYCRPGDRVTVRAEASGGQAVVEVADTGPGIDPADLPHVFERLWRGKASGGVSGSGIGLAVVRELVSAHGGTVGAASSPGRGTTFTIRIPLARQVD